MTQGPPTDAQFARMQQGGVGVFRAFFAWRELEPAQGQFDFSTVDAIVRGAAEHGIEVLPYLFASPDWLAALNGADCGDQCPIYAPQTDAALDAWKQFVAATVKRYGPDGEFWEQNKDVPAMPIRAWQIWNEQNSPTFYAPKPDPASYERLVATATDQIHAIDPGAEIVLGGMFGTPLGGRPPAITGPDFLADLYRIEGDQPRFDAVAVHPYGAQPAKVTEQVNALHDVIEQAGDDARLWVTEIGWSSADGSEPLDRGSDGQAERLGEAFSYLIDHRDELNLQGVAWYSWADLTGAGICAWCAHSGLFTEDGTAKPAWATFTGFTGGS
jgi:polysaccharide biosynthesis protein PslG